MPEVGIRQSTAKRAASVQAVGTESNHRIANNLSVLAGLVGLQASEIARKGHAMSARDVRALLDSLRARIDAVGRLHRMLATGDRNMIDLSGYLREISAAVTSSFCPEDKFQITDSSPAECWIDPGMAVSIGLVVGEAITNAVKYAHPSGISGVIDVSCRRTDEGIFIEIADDGVGLPDGFDRQAHGGLGMRLVRSLADQLGAALDLDDSGGLGLCVRLQIPGPLKH